MVGRYRSLTDNRPLKVPQSNRHCGADDRRVPCIAAKGVGWQIGLYANPMAAIARKILAGVALALPEAWPRSERATIG
jgi:hypothetical protein